MSSFEIAGKLYKKFDTQQVTESFKKRELVILVQDGQYEQFIKFELMQDGCSKIDPFQLGEMIKVHFNLRGREYGEKYFTNLNAWRIEAATQQNEAPPVNTNTATPAQEKPSDLPF